MVSANEGSSKVIIADNKSCSVRKVELVWLVTAPVNTSLSFLFFLCSFSLSLSTLLSLSISLSLSLAPRLMKNSPPIVLGQVRVPDQLELAKKHTLSNYPQLLIFRYGEKYEYGGPKDSEDGEEEEVQV